MHRMDTNNQIEYHHSMSIQLRWMDADAFGHVNNTMYFQYYDTAKMDYFRKVCHEIVDKYAIVTVPSSTLSTSPRVPKDKTEEAFLLNEGYKVQIVDSVKTGEGENALMWYDVTTADGHRAWIKQGDIEII